MLSAAKLENFLNQFDWTDPAYPGLATKVSIITKLKVANIRNPVCMKGTYTPNNDYLYLRQNIPADQSPNFIILMCSGQLTLTVQTPVTYAAWALPLFKMWSLFLPTDAPYPINGLYIEGRTANVPAPMPQGTPVDYLMISGQAEIT